jgi:type IV secretory pathway VirB4 component
VPLLSDLKEILLKKAEDKKVPAEFQYLCRKQAEVLKLFTGKGMYANLTDRESTVKADNSFIVFDTSGISDNDKKAVGLAVFVISNYCLQKAKQNRELNRLSQLAMDECWYLAQYPAGLAFLLRIAKTARHLRLQPIFATQEIGEFFGVKGVEAILKNTSTKILLKLVGDDIEHAKGLLQLNPNQVEKVMNLHLVKGVYSQALIHQTSILTNWPTTSQPLTAPKPQCATNTLIHTPLTKTRWLLWEPSPNGLRTRKAKRS